MSKETIELLKILKDETQSRSVFQRCEAEIASLKWAKPMVADVGHILPGGENEAGLAIWRNGNVVFVR